MTNPAPDSRLVRIREQLNRDAGEMARFLSFLVALDTENPPGRNYAPCLELLESKCRELGFNSRRLDIPVNAHGPAEPRAALEAGHGSGPPMLYFHGHYDVVPAQSRDQFRPRREGNFLFGRGSADMKGGLVAMLWAAKALRDCDFDLDGRIALMFVPDEETGGERGTRYLADHGLLVPGAVGMLTPEPTSGRIWNACRGAISMRVRVGGKTAHVGQHYQGENAFERMHQIVGELLKLKRKVARHRTREKIAPARARNSILLVGGESQGGTNFNAVPQECSFTVDRRINPEENLEAEMQRLMQVFDRFRRRGIPIEVEVFQQGVSALCAETSPLGNALGRSIAAVTGKRPVFEMCPGLLETRFYAQRSIPAYAYGPGLLSVAHGPNEYVDLRRVADCAEVYALSALALLSTPER